MAIRKHVHVLLIEDSETDRLLITRRLIRTTGIGFSLKVAPRLSAGLERLAEGNVDVLLLDLNLPDSSGLETLVKARWHAPELPIVVLTGLDDEELGLEAIRQGAEDYLAKGNLQSDLLSRSLLYAIERKKMEAAEQQLVVAKQIQQRLYPASAPAVAGLEIAGFCYPAAMAGGDYYDYIPLLNGNLAVVIADVSGHGVGAALLVAELRSSLRGLARTSSDLSNMLAAINDILVEDSLPDQFATVFLCSIDSAARQFSYIGAGHNGHRISRDGAVRALDSTSYPLGLQKQAELFGTIDVDVDDGDVMLLMTDGIPETRSADEEAFGTQRALDTVVDNLHEPASTIASSLFEASKEFGGERQLDDIAVVVVKFVEP